MKKKTRKKKKNERKGETEINKNYTNNSISINRLGEVN